MKIGLAQLNFRIGDFEGNTRKILAAVDEARLLGADLVVFPELSVCGYPPWDFLEFDDFIRKSGEAVGEIAKKTADVAVIVGAPSLNPDIKGKSLYNTAWFLKDRTVGAMVHKTLLPNYDVFDEYRYFEPNHLPGSLIACDGKKIALTVCEDLWNVADDPLYVTNPMDELAKLGPDLVVNIAASPFDYTQAEKRLDILSRNARQYKVPVVYVNQVGGQTGLLFDGGSMVLTPDGKQAVACARFREEVRIVDVESGIRNPECGIRHPESGISQIHEALVMGIRDYFGKLGFTKATLGLSGGIDSAVTLVLAAEALGKENVLPLLLPSRFSSEHSITDAEDLCRNLGIGCRTLSIEEAFSAVEKTLAPHFTGFPFNVTEENIQARLRAVILMAFSNKFGYILLNTSNKSEAAVGYGTLYGDMCGGLSVLGDLYKTQVYKLAAEINSRQAVIPENTITKPPSAELRPGQKDCDSLPEYAILDKILFEYIENRMGPEELIAKGYEEKVVRRVLRLVNTSEYKRHQSPPILRISPKAFGSGRRMPIVGKYLS